MRVHEGGTVHHGGGHYYHSDHHGPHRVHRHWNAAGPAYAEASTLTDLVIVAANLPENIEGVFTPPQEANWRRDWPTLAAQLVADGLTLRTDGKVTGSVSQVAPSTGYYMKLDILYIDVGDISTNADGTARLEGSSLAAHGIIMNATSNKIVADVKFTEGSGWTGHNQFEVFMARVGSSLGDWFKEKRGTKK